ncbi:MAG: DUF3857 and transglutaminase domain-containing protein [Saprospiraceae bacterium]|nr:DUF3857 and transglutaminase domain-containing protein [Saprospiraceae bacterium]
MRCNLNILLLIALFSTSLSAQTKELKVKFGKISDEEMTMRLYPADPSAPAVVLFDKGRVSHRYVENKGFILEFERHIRIKIFNKEAYDLANVAILHFNTQKVVDLKAASYNLENGKIVESKIGKGDVFDEPLTRSRLVKKVTIPAVREGSVIEFRYILSDEGLGGIPDWEFQREDIPTVWSEYEASVPSFIEFRKMAQGWEPFTLSEEEEKTEYINISFMERSGGYVTTSKGVNARVEYTCNNMHFIQENLPALKPEPFVRSVRDYLSQISFDIRAVYTTDVVPSGGIYRLQNRSYRERNVSWEMLGAEMLEDVYQSLLKPSRQIESDVLQAIAGKTTDDEKIAALYAFVCQSYQIKPLNLIWPTQKPEDIVKNRTGTPTELNLVLVNMMRKAGLEAHPLLLGTRKTGRIVSYRVTTDAFNRVAAAVKTGADSWTLLDVVGWPNPVGLLPEEDLNGAGLLLTEKEAPTWLPVQNAIAQRRAVVSELSLDPAGGLSGEVTVFEAGYNAVAARVKIRATSAEEFTREQFKELVADGKMSNLRLENADSWNEPEIKMMFNLQTNSFVQRSGDKIYLNPTLGFGLKENPFKQPERKFHIDLGVPENLTLSFSIKIPPGYQVEEFPKIEKMTFGDASALTFQYLTEVTPEVLNIVVRYRVNNPEVFLEQYEDLRLFFSKVVAKLDEQVVLTKI